MAALTTFTFPFVGGYSFYTGTGSTTLVPDIFPIGINGRPYMLDMRSGKFMSGHEPRIRDSVDQSTAPGEAAINPGGLWRRSKISWHEGAGQKYGDRDDSEPYRFFTSKGLDPWTRGQLSLLNATALNAGTNAPTSNVGKALAVSGKLFVIDGTGVSYATTVSGNWTALTMPTSTTAVHDIATDGTSLFVAVTATTSGVYAYDIASPGSGTRQIYDTVTGIDYVNGRLMATKENVLYDGTAQAYTAGSLTSTILTQRNTAFRWVGSAAGQGFIYAAGYAGKTSLVYKTTIKTDATALDAASVALQLPDGEVVTAIYGYLGYIFIGSDKGVRMAIADADGNLTVGALIQTTSSVLDFIGQDRFVWFTWSNYDTTSGGLGRLDLSTLTAANTPAYATDLMYDTTAVIKSVTNFVNAAGVQVKVFTVTGVGVVYENTGSLVSSATMESGRFTWGIPDRKFVAKFDLRAQPLNGTVAVAMQSDNGSYATLGTWSTASTTEETHDGPETKVIEAQFKLTFTRSGTDATKGPVLTRWSARAYAAPYRSRFWQVPLLIHKKISIQNRDYFMEVDEERSILHGYLDNPSIISYQEGKNSYSVIVEDLEWAPVDSHDNEWVWDGTCTLTLRSVEE